MEWIKNYLPLIGSCSAALIGAFTALLVNWFQIFKKEAEGVQDWYEKNYIFEAIDPLVLALSQLSYLYANTRYKIPLSASDIVPPLEAVERVQTLLNGGRFDLEQVDFRDATKYLYVKAHLLTDNDIGNGNLMEWIKTCETLTDCLVILRIQLLKLRVRKKHQVYDIYKNQDIQVVADQIAQKAQSIKRLADPEILKRFPPYNQF